MYKPDLPSFCALAQSASVVPLCQDLPADLETPVGVFLKLRDEEASPYWRGMSSQKEGGGLSFLLESVAHGDQPGRYTFLGTNCRRSIELRGGKAIVRNGDRSEEVELGPEDGLDLLRSTISATRVAMIEGLPPFFGGAVGFVGYDAVRFFERVPTPESDELGLPDALFLLPDTTIIFDHVQHHIKIVHLAEIAGDPSAAYASAASAIARIVARIEGPVPRPTTPCGSAQTPLASNISQSGFEENVRRAKDYIAAGDTFQIVLSQRFRRETSAEAFSIYRALRMLNPSPYLFFLDCGSFQLIGSSPEGLVKLENGWAETNPIAGTRRRGSTAAEDEALAAELLADPKERAEHIMLVDLGRNDIGRTAEPGTVSVASFMRVERFSHVMHLVSRVSGRLRPDYEAFSLLRATFPAGTVSGAPKVRAMEIVAELEGERRGPYAGAVGYFAFGGNMDTCITIRTIVKRGTTVYLQAGAGIVADSDPAREYQETADKAKALETAIAIAEAGVRP